MQHAGMKPRHAFSDTADSQAARGAARPRLERFGVLATLLVLVAILIGTLTPPEDMPSDVPGSDKLHHFLAFAAFVLPLTLLRPGRWVWLVPLAALLGVAIELVQPYFGRERAVGDMIANALGAGFGALLARLLHRPALRLLRR